MKMILTLLFLSITLNLLAPEYPVLYIGKGEKIEPYEAIWNAVTKVESSGNRFAYHLEDNGTESLGIAQIQECRVKEYNRLSGSNLKHSDVYNPEISKRIFLFYADRYGVYQTDKFIRSWNGSGKATYKYLAKVRNQLISNQL
jgi:hypothetical protein